MANYSISIGRFKRDELNVVIDVLRASSTIVVALASGIREIVPIGTEEAALELKKEGYTIAGEYEGIKLPKFDIGNSPVELLEEIERSKIEKLALKTTNTTGKLIEMKDALICSSLNLTAIKNVLKILNKKDKNTNIIAVGSEHGITEDLAVAFSLYANLNGELKIEKNFLRECIFKSNTAKHLIKLGYGSDVKFISNIDRYNVVPVMRKGIIRRL
ncbi:MAG: 2-phosphosulfolactate phosphatase [Candidatus Methanolliviera sp. GoM_asphalt]|nr:MAG: 2-phosphosulfolactate phosphatase [Candidatus Methanolliviera sp. GoM_asphalt]